MELDLGLSCSVLPEECVSLHKLHVILLRHSNIKDTLKTCIIKRSFINACIICHFLCPHLIVSAGPLRLLYDGRKCIREVFEQEVLLLHVHAQDPVEELTHLVVSLIQGQHTGAVFTGSDQSNPN